MEINLKRTTKVQLYEMLCEAQKECEKLREELTTAQISYKRLEENSISHIETINEELRVAVEEKNAANEDAELARKLCETIKLAFASERANYINLLCGRDKHPRGVHMAAADQAMAEGRVR